MSSSMENNNTFHSCEYKDNIAILRQMEFFSKMPLETIKIFAYLCTKEIFRPDDYLFRQGEDDGQAFYLLSGKVNLIRETEKGEIVIREYEKEVLLGSMSLMGNCHRLYSLKAITDVTSLVMYREKMLKALEQFPGLMPTVISSFVKRVCEWEEKFLMNMEKNEACLKMAGVSLI